MSEQKNNYLKHFNPNHDPKNGQFTFGNGGSGSIFVKKSRKHRKEDTRYLGDTSRYAEYIYNPPGSNKSSGGTKTSSSNSSENKYEPKFERDQSGSSSNSKESSSDYEYKFERNQSGTGAGPGDKKQEFDYTPKFERDQSSTSSETAKKTGMNESSVRTLKSKEGSGASNSSKNDNAQQQKSIFDPYIKGGKDKPNKSPAQVYTNEAGNILRGAQKINDIYSNVSKNAKIKEMKSNLWQMSDDDLRNAINRMDLEQRYMSLASRDIEAGKDSVSRFLDVAIPVTDALGSMATIASVYYDLKKSD